MEEQEKYVYKVSEFAKIIGKPETTVRLEINKGNIEARKSGTTWLIPKSEVNRYLGIEDNEQNYKKDVYIKELEGKVKTLETQIKAFKQVASSLNHIIEI